MEFLRGRCALGPFRACARCACCSQKRRAVDLTKLPESLTELRLGSNQLTGAVDLPEGLHFCVVGRTSTCDMRPGKLRETHHRPAISLGRGSLHTCGDVHPNPGPLGNGGPSLASLPEPRSMPLRRAAWRFTAHTGA